MSLSKYQLERADFTVTIEQGRRVEIELFRENRRNLETMGDLLKSRVFGATEYAIQLRKRMTKYVQGGGTESLAHGGGGNQVSAIRLHPPEPYVQGDGGGAGGSRQPRPRPPEPYPDPHPEHGVLCDCDDCDEAVKRLLRDCGVLPSAWGKRYTHTIVQGGGGGAGGSRQPSRPHPPEPSNERKPARHRRDESDK